MGGEPRADTRAWQVERFERMREEALTHLAKVRPGRSAPVVDTSITRSAPTRPTLEDGIELGEKGPNTIVRYGP